MLIHEHVALCEIRFWLAGLATVGHTAFITVRGSDLCVCVQIVGWQRVTVAVISSRARGPVDSSSTSQTTTALCPPHAAPASARANASTQTLNLPRLRPAHSI